MYVSHQLFEQLVLANCSDTKAKDKEIIIMKKIRDDLDKKIKINMNENNRFKLSKKRLIDALGEKSYNELKNIGD
jgi:hypothetical protein